MGNCLKTQLKAVVNNPNLPYFGEDIYEGTFSKKNNNMYNVALENIEQGDVLMVYIKSSISYIDTEQLSLYVGDALDSGNTLSNVVSLSDKDLSIGDWYKIEYTGTISSVYMKIYSARGYNDMVFNTKIIKMYK